MPFDLPRASSVLHFDTPKKRNNTRHRDIDSLLLNAGREAFIKNGIRATSMSAVARAAGVSRPTLYSRYRNIDLLTGDVLRHEYLTVLEGAFDRVTSPEQFIDQIVYVADSLRSNEFITSVAQSDPDILHHFLFGHLVGTQRRLVDYLKRLIDAVRDQAIEQDSESRIREGDPEVLAIFVVMTVQSAILSAPAVASIVPRPDKWCLELHRLVSGYLLECKG
ncbi:TetR/AcrR family transcriptional regulator [Corynebacterium pseudopelargi]|uniref:Transcriptional regulator, TetR family n=1 Tax=Corynebacterium pseudopelargi TaxID=2080757 RepID=A0A3G6IUJ4_9CORY|nr:TetR/AcrR family transcriptional regulator [Corynebacterium pseudopelargi]AZA09435.1 Transcriptional regulator, TetR family [Corynebacterium pseudopelargi]